MTAGEVHKKANWVRQLNFFACEGIAFTLDQSADTIERLESRVAELEAGIVHLRNACLQRCELQDCDAWKGRGMQCPTCPMEWVDELDAAIAAEAE